MHRLSKSLLGYIISIALCSVTLLSAFVLASSTISADDIVSDVSISVPVSCNVTSTLDSAHSATINNGTFEENIGTTTFKTVCNDNSGYALYAIGYSNEEFGNTKLLATVGGQLSPTNDIATGLATSGDASAWAMKLSPVAGTYAPTIESDTNGSFSSYHVVPDIYAKVATFTSNTDAVIGSSVQSTYRAYVDRNKPAGTYAGKVRYSLVHPNDAAAPVTPFACPANYICYHPNAEDVVGSMNAINEYAGDTTSNIGYQTASSSSEIILNSSNFSRSGYGFAAWNTSEDGTGTNYGPSQTITTGNLSSRGLNLYAKWVPAETNVTMQTFSKNATPYNTMPIGTVIALRDIRDDNTYSVAKLADGEWWMIENLRLDVGTANITNTNTNNPPSTFLQELQNATSTSSWCNDDYDSTCTDQVLYNTSNINRSLAPDPNIHRDDQGNVIEASWYSYGIYYNFYTANAGYGMSDYYYDRDNIDLPQDGNVYWPTPHSTGDICPSGWNIPTAFSATNYTLAGNEAQPDIGSYAFYYQGFGDYAQIRQKVRIYPNNFVPNGGYATEEQYGRGVEGILNVGQTGVWTSTINDSNGDSPNIFASMQGWIGDGATIDGYPVRCIAH